MMGELRHLQSLLSFHGGFFFSSVPFPSHPHSQAELHYPNVICMFSFVILYTVLLVHVHVLCDAVVFVIPLHTLCCCCCCVVKLSQPINTFPSEEMHLRSHFIIRTKLYLKNIYNGAGLQCHINYIFFQLLQFISAPNKHTKLSCSTFKVGDEICDLLLVTILARQTKHHQSHDENLLLFLFMVKT